VAQQTKNARNIVIFLLFIAYFILAARPVHRETILAPAWLSSLQTNSSVQVNAPVSGGADQMGLIPFALGSHFGYVNTLGNFAINNVKTGEIYLSENLWTEYGAQPEKLEIKNISAETAISIESIKGYPILLDNRIFILGRDQNALSEIDNDGNVMWTYEFGAPLTCIDAAGGIVLTGSIDGIIEILDSGGRRIFTFEPGGSRYAVILGCALSRNGSRIGIISGVDQQRFLMLERYGSSGGEYKVVYHEFLDSGFRRPVRISFVDEDRRVVYEQSKGIGCYNIKSRQGIRIPLNGEIAAIDDSGDNGFLFLITSHSTTKKELIGIKFPNDGWSSFLFSRQDKRDAIFMKAPFKSDNVFLKRISTGGMPQHSVSASGTRLIAGGGTTLISFNLEER